MNSCIMNILFRMVNILLSFNWDKTRYHNLCINHLLCRFRNHFHKVHRSLNYQIMEITKNHPRRLYICQFLYNSSNLVSQEHKLIVFYCKNSLEHIVNIHLCHKSDNLLYKFDKFRIDYQRKMLYYTLSKWFHYHSLSN